MPKIATKTIPAHLAIIPDGNRRWARLHRLPEHEGHREGGEVTFRIIQYLFRQGVPVVSFWAMSLDNLQKRSKQEVKFLLKTFQEKFREMGDDPKIHKGRIRVQIFGRWSELFPKRVVEAMQYCIDQTSRYRERTLNFFIAYSGIDEMLQAMDDMIKVHPEVLSWETVKEHLWTRALPPVDYLVRTGGEPHFSTGFMMWDVADAQMYFSKKLWPSMRTADFRRMLDDFAERTRRYGK